MGVIARNGDTIDEQLRDMDFDEDIDEDFECDEGEDDE